MAALVNYATSRNPFAINNGWGFSWFEDEIEVTGDKDLGTYHFRLPNFFLLTDVAARQTRHLDIFIADAVRAWEGAVANGSVVVFAAGNDGWNSVTGQHKVYRTPLLDGQGHHRAWSNYRGEERFDYIETTSRLIRINQTTNASVQVPDNIPNLESSYFMTDDKLKGSWLAVVNVDKIILSIGPATDVEWPKTTALPRREPTCCQLSRAGIRTMWRTKPPPD